MGDGPTCRLVRIDVESEIPPPSGAGLLEETVMTAAGTHGESAFAPAKEQYAEWGVDVEAAMRRLGAVARAGGLSMSCQRTRCRR